MIVKCLTKSKIWLTGDCTGLRGDCTVLRGDLNDIPMSDRKDHPNLSDWVILEIGDEKSPQVPPATADDGKQGE